MRAAAPVPDPVEQVAAGLARVAQGPQVPEPVEQLAVAGLARCQPQAAPPLGLCKHRRP